MASPWFATKTDPTQGISAGLWCAPSRTFLGEDSFQAQLFGLKSPALGTQPLVLMVLGGLPFMLWDAPRLRPSFSEPAAPGSFPVQLCGPYKTISLPLQTKPVLGGGRAGREGGRRLVCAVLSPGVGCSPRLPVARSLAMRCPSSSQRQRGKRGGCRKPFAASRKPRGAAGNCPCRGRCFSPSLSRDEKLADLRASTVKRDGS